jgi:uncharacterized protein (DUF1501 family)
MSIDRRTFLRQAGMSLAAGATMSTLGTLLPAFKAQAAETDGYKALVCVFLYGGMDNHDVIIPYDQPSYDQYSGIRAPLLDLYGSARSRDTLLPLNPLNSSDFDGRTFALPPELSGIKSLFDSGNAAIVGNVGPLVQPLTRSQWENDTAASPGRLFSHNDQQSTWMGLRPEGSSVGWGGRFADMAINSGANRFEAFSAVSASGNSLFLNGVSARPYPVTSHGGAEFELLSELAAQGGPDAPARYDAVRRFFSAGADDYNNLFERDIANANRKALLDNEAYNDAFRGAPELVTEFPGGLGEQLRSVAQSISLRGSLGMRRQVFFVGLGGFDTHSNQTRSLPALQRQLDGAVTSFFTSMEEMGLTNDVTLFTASDFGRTLTVNGDGTDHGWGGHHFMIGGGVNGNQIYGDIPPSVLGHSQDAGNGRLIPSTSLHQFAAPMGRWFGLSDDELAQALPGLSNFESELMPILS